MGVFCSHVYLRTACVLVSKEAQEGGVRCLGTRVRDSQVTVSVLGPPEEQTVILTTEPFPSHLQLCVWARALERGAHGCPSCENPLELKFPGAVSCSHGSLEPTSAPLEEDSRILSPL